jgi:hypothetical protein
MHFSLVWSPIVIKARHEVKVSRCRHICNSWRKSRKRLTRKKERNKIRTGQEKEKDELIRKERKIQTEVMTNGW